MQEQNFKIQYDLTEPKESNLARIDLNQNFIRDLRDGIPEIAKFQFSLRAHIGNSSIEIQGIKDDELIWASTVTVYSENRMFGTRRNELSYGTTGAFSPDDSDDSNSVIRTFLAYHLMQNWKFVKPLVNKYTDYYEQLLQQIKEVNPEKPE